VYKTWAEIEEMQRIKGSLIDDKQLDLQDNNIFTLQYEKNTQKPPYITNDLAKAKSIKSGF
jgi:hypothetical protein